MHSSENKISKEKICSVRSWKLFLDYLYNWKMAFCAISNSDIIWGFKEKKVLDLEIQSFSFEGLVSVVQCFLVLTGFYTPKSSFSYDTGEA